MPTETPFTHSLDLPDPDATAALGRALAACLDAGDVLALSGPIGAGKSHLARALIKTRLAAVGRDEDVPSPTFTLVQSYDADDLEIWHCDLYRLGHSDEVLELGLNDAFDRALTVIEWPDRLGADLPARALHLRLTPAQNGTTRHAAFHGPASFTSRLAHLKAPAHAAG